jgi:hypothetical protein
MLLTLAVILLLVLPDPWNVIAAAGCVLLGLVELYAWNRTVRGRRRVVGAQALVGQTGQVRATCRPLGQVFVAGELWRAHCEVGPADPARQLKLCAEFEDGRDAVACIRGTKVQNLVGASTGAYVRLLAGCETFAGGVRAACYLWLGKVVAVLTDGAFLRDGCQALEPEDARRLCAKVPASSRARL